MATAQPGDRVRVYYRGLLENDRVIDETPRDEPFDFELGEGEAFQGLEHVVDGMEEGEARTVVLPPEKAFGAYQPDLVLEVVRSHVEVEGKLEVGSRMTVQADPEGEAVEVTITRITDETVTLDANHPLAGETVVLWVHLLEILT